MRINKTSINPTLHNVIQNHIVRVNGNTNDVHFFMEEARSDIRDIFANDVGPDYLTTHRQTGAPVHRSPHARDGTAPPFVGPELYDY